MIETWICYYDGFLIGWECWCLEDSELETYLSSFIPGDMQNTEQPEAEITITTI